MLRDKRVTIILVWVLLLAGACQPVQAPSQAGAALEVAPTVAPTPEPPAPTPEPSPTPAPKPAADVKVSSTGAKITSQALAGNLLGDPAERTALVLLPPSYETSDKRYPVVYVMPWAFGQPGEDAVEFRDAMTSLLRNGEIGEMILVVPDGANQLGASLFRSSPTIGDYETYVTQEVVDYIDAHFRTLNARESRGLAGCGNGGTAAMRLALKYPAVFSVANVTDGDYDGSLEAHPSDVEAVKSLTALPQDASQLDQTGITGWYIEAAAANAPDPNNPPFYAEMPFRIVDGHGELVPEVIAKIVENDAVHEAHRYIEQPVRLDALLIRHGLHHSAEGTAATRSFDQLLTELGIDHEYLETETGWCGGPWEKDTLKFMSENLDFGED